VLIHQEFNLAEDLSIAQNIFLGHEKKSAAGCSTTRHARRAPPPCCAQVGLRRRPRHPVRQLIVAEKQLVEIAKALARRARC
jgi:ribose transport system ATP-binding protein